MSAGLPGLGLGGLFFILSALVAPLVELVRTVRGQSSAAAWRGVGRQFAMAASMIVAVELTLRAFFLLGALAGVEGAGGDRGLSVLPLGPIGIAAAVLAGLLISAKALALAMRPRRRSLPRFSPTGALEAGRRLILEGRGSS